MSDLAAKIESCGHTLDSLMTCPKEEFDLHFEKLETLQRDILKELNIPPETLDEPPPDI